MLGDYFARFLWWRIIVCLVMSLQQNSLYFECKFLLFRYLHRDGDGSCKRIFSIDQGTLAFFILLYGYSLIHMQSTFLPHISLLSYIFLHAKIQSPSQASLLSTEDPSEAGSCKRCIHLLLVFPACNHKLCSGYFFILRVWGQNMG
jgi:hypothetical protein